MGCFLGCFGAAKDSRRRKKRSNRGSPQRQRNRVQNVLQENLVNAGQSVKETNPKSLDSELRNNIVGAEQSSLAPEQGTTCDSNITIHERVSVLQSVDFLPEGGTISTDKEKQQDLKTFNQAYSISGDDNSITSSVGSYPSNLKDKSKEAEQLTPSPKKRVTFNSNVTMYEHVSVHESIDFQKEVTMQDDLETSTQSYSISEDDNSVTSSVGSYPPNHRYHNARDSDDEGEEYDNCDLSDMDDEDDEDYYDDYDDDIHVRVAGEKVWSESVFTPSMESRTGNPSPQAIDEEVESHMVEPLPPDEEFKALRLKINARDRSNYINSVLNPVENTTQWKAAKSRGQHLLNTQKENLAVNFETARVSFSSEPTFVQSSFISKTKFNQSRKADQEIAVDASLSNWLSSPETTPSKKTNINGLETVKSGQSMSECCTPVRSFEDRPILGALTVEELRQISKSASPRKKSPSRSPDEMPIIGTVGTYWNDLHSANKHSDSSPSLFKGIPNTTSKYREDKKVNWHSTPFEKRLDQALNQGAAEA